MRIHESLQTGFSFCGSSVRVTCTNTYKRSKTVPKMKVNLFDSDGVLIEKEENVSRSLRRARVSVVDYALTNNFEFFGTITFNSKWHDVTDVKSCLDSVINSFDNYRQRFNSAFRYILVPEFGERKGRLHFHFLVSGINKEDLFINKHKYLDWRYTSSRFGHTQITRIRGRKEDRENVARYCSKYITKGNIRISNHRYFCSKDLARPEIVRNYDALFTVFVSDWLQENCMYPYADNRMCKAFSIPMCVYYDLMEAIEKEFYGHKFPEEEDDTRPILIDITDRRGRFLKSPWEEEQLCIDM